MDRPVTRGLIHRQESTDAVAVNTESVNTESINAESVNTESINAESVNTESMDTESRNTKSMDTESMSTEGKDEERMHSESMKMNTENLQKKAMIAMSGGVDSSLAAQLVKEAGYECLGCTMRLYDNEDIGLSRGHTCCSLEDVEDARSVACRIGIPYYVFNFKDDFHEKVISRFISSYEHGITPNPCIDCNRYMKFEKLYDRAKLLGCEYLVTGHYARIEERDGMYLLKKALDETKDQSYVLYSMTQEQLAHTLFPLGGMRKKDVRVLADQYGFVNADKPDSQDICFVPDGDYVAFLERHTGKKYRSGDFLDKDGHILGRHKGTVSYTIGQRKGLGIACGKPMYVKEIDVESNTVTLAENADLYEDTLTADEFHWISGLAPQGELLCKARIRYHHKEQDARVCSLTDDRVRIIFKEPQRAITPGQAVVLYDGDIVLGGGRIL